MGKAHTNRCLAGRRLTLAALALALAVATLTPVPAVRAGASAGGTDGAFELHGNQEKILYALGLSLAERLGEFDLSERDLAVVEAGMREGLAGDPQVSLGIWAHRVEGLRKTRMEQTARQEKRAAEAFLAAARAEAGTVKRASGLIYRELRGGDGPKPGAGDRVSVHYHGTRIDGTVFDSSINRGKPSTFGLGGVIACWREGVQMMRVGAKAKLVCPAPIAYGRKGLPGKIKPGATLVFEVELLAIVDPQAAPAAKR